MGTPVTLVSADGTPVDPASGADLTATNVLLGAVNETAPATDTASSGANGRLQRVAQRLTSLIGLLPASLGAKAAAASLAVTQSTEDAAQLGSLTETAPTTDTASSGLNGRLQRIAQRLSSLLGCTVTKTSVNSAATSTQLLAANAARKTLKIVNTDANILYIDDSGGTATSACIPVASGGYWESTMPVTVTAVTGIWAADGVGAATVFEGA